MKILYAGDSPAGGPANYLMGILKHLKAEYVHIPPSLALEERWLRLRYDAILLSDYPRVRLAPRIERLIMGQLEEGAGLAMIGGWASFSGPLGGWKGSEIEKALPVACLGRDDRLDFPGGALVFAENPHPVLNSVPFDPPPVLCGLNRVRPRKKSKVLLSARKISFKQGANKALSLAEDYPLLVADAARRRAAFATDAAPHWCGGLVDWGKKKLKLHVKGDIWIEVGDAYVRFFSNLIRWLAGEQT